MQSQQELFWRQQQQQQHWGRPEGGALAGNRHLLQAIAPLLPGSPGAAPAQLQNETILVPPCLLSSTYYKNTCKQCNYSRVAVRVTVWPLRRGVLNSTSTTNPLGFVAPTIAVVQGGSIVVIAGYSGPNNHPNSSAPAYPGKQPLPGCYHLTHDVRNGISHPDGWLVQQKCRQALLCVGFGLQAVMPLQKSQLAEVEVAAAQGAQQELVSKIAVLVSTGGCEQASL